MTVRAKAIVSEHSAQSEVVKWCVEHPDPRCWLIAAIPNGGKRSARAGAELKKEGLRPGFPDLILPVAASGYHGLFIEMKKVGGKLSPEQRHWLKDLSAQGYKATACYMHQEAIAVIEQYLDIAAPSC
jgi:hypothetical protein